MRIICQTRFKHGRDIFEVGDVRTVPDETGAYFVDRGWATAEGVEPGQPAEGEVVLDVQDGLLATGNVTITSTASSS